MEYYAKQGPITKATTSFFKGFKGTCEYAGIKTPPEIILIASVAGAVILGFLSAIIDPVLGFLVFFLIVDIGIGGPYFLADKKIAEIEKNLPDVLHHMGTTLKTGGTVEVALKEVSQVDYGPITEQVKVMLREINEGKTFEEAFYTFAKKSRSEITQRTATIIIAARKAGGGLLDTLSSMSEDIRAISRLKRERASSTAMQFMFILAAAVFVAPLVFGVVKSVLEILLNSSVDETTKIQSLALMAQFDFTFKAYVVLETLLNTIGAVMIKTGKASKAIPYLPMTMLVAYLIYVGTASSFLSLIGG